MWHQSFDKRLESWAALRDQVQHLPLQESLHLINQWWFNSPWQAYYLHWDDQPRWPDPWQLLSDNVFCEVARGLGILYTISMINHPEIASADLVTTKEGYNLVRINKGIYILNWDKDTIVNTHSVVNVTKQLKQDQIKKQYK